MWSVPEAATCFCAFGPARTIDRSATGWELKQVDRVSVGRQTVLTETPTLSEKAQTNKDPLLGELGLGRRGYSIEQLIRPVSARAGSG